jgi:hypothetical protein
MPKPPATGSVPTVHAAGVAPPVPKGQLDPCRHRRNKKKKTKFVVYMAQEIGSDPPKYYVGRTRGIGTVAQIINSREQGHHRTDIGALKKVCEQDTYAACRGAEQLHYLDMVKNNKAITSPRQPGKGAQIAPISKDNPKKDDYLACAKASAKNVSPPCPVCSA